MENLNQPQKLCKDTDIFSGSQYNYSTRKLGIPLQVPLVSEDSIEHYADHSKRYPSYGCNRVHRHQSQVI